MMSNFVNYAPYIQGTVKRKKTTQQLLKRRYKYAWEIAKKASSILKQEYFATEVIVFGSLLHKELFSLTSDIDLAVNGIPPDRFFHAFYKVAFLEDIKVEIVDIEECKDYIRESIKKEGVKL